MIVGIGLDLVETSRFARPSRRLLERAFTAAERAYCAGAARPAIHLAARFAAKEAVLKALGTGWSGGIAWTDVEVTRGPSGAPGVKLRGKAAAAAKRLGIRRWRISLTHVRALAAAVAVAER